MTPNRLPIWKSVAVGAAMLMAMFLPAAPPAAGPPTVVIDNLTQVEGTGGTNLMLFTVRLTGTSDQQTVVNYSTGDDPGGLHPAKAGSACGSDTEDGSDFFSLTSAVTIPADSVNPPSATIPIVTCGDGRNEFDETFAV